MFGWSKMRKLTPYEINILDEVIGFSSGWVLDFTNATFESFFKYFNIDIYDEKYAYYGVSKGKRFRRFLEISEPKKIVEVLNELSLMIKEDEKKKKIIKIINNINQEKRDIFIQDNIDFKSDINKIKKKLYRFYPIDKIIDNRLNEIIKSYQAESYFSVIVLCGSILEGILLSVAMKNPKKFNLSNKSPKKNDKVKPFKEWKLANFIDVAYDIGFLDKVSQKYSHILREFRNYIHPFEAYTNKHFDFDQKSAEISIKVLIKAFDDLESSFKGN